MTTRSVDVSLELVGPTLKWTFLSDGVVSSTIPKHTAGDIVFNITTPGFQFCSPPDIDKNAGDQLSLPSHRPSFTEYTATVKDIHTLENTSGSIFLFVQDIATLSKYKSPDPVVDNDGEHDPGN